MFYLPTEYFTCLLKLLPSYGIFYLPTEHLPANEIFYLPCY
jgi:hypothetical protein